MRLSHQLATSGSIMLALLLAATAQPALADPPDWAPAHGYRDKHDYDYDHHRHKKHHKHRHDHDDDDYDDDYDDDRGDRDDYPRRVNSQYWGGYDPRYSTRYGANKYGIGRGTCNQAQFGNYLGGGNVGGALGNSIGNAVGSAMGQQGNPLLGAIAGAVVNQMLGNRVGQAMDQGDRFCFSQALEYGYDQRPITWVNRNTSSEYRVVPLRSYQNPNGNWCREFNYQVTQNGALLNNATNAACRLADGSWQ